jgi:hypothetical protein
MLATGRWLKATARALTAAVVCTSFTLAPTAPPLSTASNAPPEKPERQALGSVWENVPHCRILLQRQHAVGAEAQPRKASVIATTLGMVDDWAAQSVQFVIRPDGACPYP